ncbi:OprD family outer membrane porin [Pseudomonas helleri]|uniref:OprD family outer membrane porin n=1 Tax=Pseudomonas helleri TaxID=1608996 RepID=UPI0028EE6592|nr:OprD family outer membrane porin [Pseudomonas helleri]
MFQFSSPLRAAKYVGLLGLVLPWVAYADMVDDSQLSLTARNLYLNRNFTNKNPEFSKIGNWSQGLDLQFKSGYSDTPLAVGLDVDGQYALRLDAHGNDGSLPYNPMTEKTAKDYSRAGATLKMRYSKTELKVGDYKPFLPVASNDPSRQLDTIYQGLVLESKELDNLTLTGGRFWSAVTRQSSDHEPFYRNGTSNSDSSKGLDFAGATYSFLPNLEATYFYGVMHDLYQQHYAGLKQTQDLGGGYSLKTELGYFNNSNDGDARGGTVDNRSYSGSMSVSKNGHLVGVAYERMLGDTGYPIINGYIPQPFLPNFAGLGFWNAGERSWSVRYGYNFATLGIPGLALLARYIKGTDIDRGAGLADGSESERDVWATYVVQTGPLKGLSFDFKNIHVQQQYGNDYDEFRLATSYTWRFW